MVNELIPNYFFLDNNLHKKLRIISQENAIVSWSYVDEKRMWHNYTLVRRNYKKAFTLEEVSQLIERSEENILSLMNKGMIDRPSGMSYTVTNKRPLKLYWSEEDVFSLREELYNMARKNKYGEPYSNFKLVSKEDLIAKINGDTSYYIKTSDGNFIRVWK